jgi:hypothetical protein
LFTRPVFALAGNPAGNREDCSGVGLCVWFVYLLRLTAIAMLRALALCGTYLYV